MGIRNVVKLFIGALDQSGDAAFLATLGPHSELIHKPTGIIFDLGGGGAYLSERKVGSHNFGGKFQFTASGGVKYIILRNFAIGYKFFHFSDAGIKDGNGLNRHLLELSYRF